MRYLVILILLCSIAEAKTLVKYHKNTGDIIQTNGVDKMPSQAILNDRFRSATTDVILVDESVSVSKQRVDLNTKTIIDISQKELDDKQALIDEKQAEQTLINNKIKDMAIAALEAEGKVFKHIKKEKWYGIFKRIIWWWKE